MRIKGEKILQHARSYKKWSLFVKGDKGKVWVKVTCLSVYYTWVIKDKLGLSIYVGGDE